MRRVAYPKLPPHFFGALILTNNNKSSIIKPEMKEGFPRRVKLTRQGEPKGRDRMRYRKKCKAGTAFFGVMVLLAVITPHIINDFGDDSNSRISEIIEEAERAETAPEYYFFDDWQPSGQKNDFWQGMGYMITPSSEMPAPINKNWWEDGEKSRRHSAGKVFILTESMPAGSFSITTGKKLVFGELANAPAMPAPITVKSGIVPTLPQDLVVEEEVESEDSGFTMPTSNSGWMEGAMSNAGAITSEEFQRKFPKIPEKTWSPRESMISAQKAIGGSGNSASCTERFEIAYARAKITGIASA